MSRSAGGAYTVPPGTEAVSAASIASASYNTLLDDLESEVTDSWSRSGKGAALANMSMGGFLLRDLGAPVNANDAVRLTDIGSLQPLDADLTAFAALAGTDGLLAKTAANAYALRALAVSGTGISVTNPRGIAGDPTVTIDPAAIVVAGGGTPAVAASQADQETATSLTTFVSPGRQQFHPGASKAWLYATVSGGVPTISVGYNITSITDTGTGRLLITINTDFSSAGWAALVTIKANTGENRRYGQIYEATAQAAGSVEISCAGTDGNYYDPQSWSFAGYGDQ